MSVASLASKIAKRTGKKSEAYLEDLRAAIKVIQDMMAEEYVKQEGFDIYTDVEDILREGAMKIAERSLKKFQGRI